MGSLLTVLSMRLNRLGERVAEVAPGLADEHAQLIDLVRNMVVSQRRIVANLRPVLLDSFGLGVALRHYVEDWGRHTGIPAEADITPVFPTLRANAGLALFRAAQEALTNVAKHANASCVRVSLNSEGRRVTMSIEDDGIGVPPGVWLLASSHGIAGMRERLMEFGGQLVVEPAPGGRGTRVRATMPR
jgi:signal transduction histidine kinase